MSSYKRKKRTLKKRILVFCEGYTENHYVVGLKNWIEQIDPSINIAIKTINIEGGGYLSILTALNKQPDSGCIAKSYFSISIGISTIKMRRLYLRSY